MPNRPAAREPLAPWLAVALVATAGLGVVWGGHLRVGGYVLACAFLLAGALRAVLPTRSVGALAIRGRVLDVVLWTGAGLAVGVGTWAVNIPPPGA